MSAESPKAGTFRVDLTKSKTPWSFAMKLRRGFWSFLLKPVYMLLPEPASRFRILLLRMMGARIGDHCLIRKHVDVLMPWNLELGAHVAIGHDVEIYNFAPVTVREMTVISQYTFLCTGSHDYEHPHFPLVYAPITIGSECWVAADVFVGPGVTIGDGAVIGARSVVTQDMPAWTVSAGNPCKPIKPRKVDESRA